MFSICHDLGIDDPISWMNSVPPVLVDWHIAYRCYKSDAEAAAYEKVRNGGKRTFNGNSSEMDEYLSGISNGRK